ncbi:MAG TPA: hypothetical protein VK559_12360 [Ferruginibacter sp.]|nr:hypothetical protein [Ferruginibacter sp.]
MGINKITINIILSLFLLMPATDLLAQTGDAVYFQWGTKQNRDKFYTNIVSHPINKNLALPLTDSTEDKWDIGLKSMQLLQYRSVFIDKRIHYAVKLMDKQSVDFQVTLLETLYSLYPTEFIKKMREELKHATDDKVFAIASEYLYRENSICPNEIAAAAIKLNFDYKNNYILKMLIVSKENDHLTKKMLQDIFNKKFLRGNTVIYSIQRKNRDYTGIAIIRDGKGNFIVDNNRNIIAIPQFARSLNNLPFYLSDGNTPQGIFKMRGTDVSVSSFIGPTPNIQLTMPFETTVRSFINVAYVKDSTWTEDQYKKLLPISWQEYAPIFQTYYASKIGRTEIIAHGTAMDPEYYKTKIYYPYTPTEGCLCTKEIWSEDDGKRMISDQQILVDALKATGNENGYYVVIEIDDQQKPVSMDEILPYIKN